MNIPIDQSYGFIIIDTAEMKAKFAPKLATDEFYHPWYETWNAGGSFGSIPMEQFPPDESNVFRRKISIEEGFELVPLDEKIQDGDWYFDSCGAWKKCSFYARENKTPRQHNADGYFFHHFRRPVKASSGWIKLTPSTLPKPEDYPCYVTDGKDVETAHGCYFGTSDGWPHTSSRNIRDADITHWMRKPKETKPQPPKEERLAVEVAFEKAFEECGKNYVKHWGQGSFDIQLKKFPDIAERIRISFDAGISFQRSQGGVK